MARNSRIQKVSWWVGLWLQWVRGVIAFCALVTMIAAWTGSRGHPWSAAALIALRIRTPLPEHDLSLGSRLFLSVWLLVGFGFTLRWISHGIELFRLHARMVLFSTENVRHFRGLGLIPIASAVLQLLFPMLANAWMLSREEARLRVSEFIAVDQVLLGVIILLISWVMDEARKLRETQNLVI